MPCMKTQISLLFLFSIALFFTACQEDDPLDPDPGQDARDVFVGSWNCVENDAKIAYTVTIKKDPSNEAKLLLENFAYIGMGEYAVATFSGTNLMVPNQIPCEGWIVQGNGKLINSNKMEWTYNVKVGGDNNYYTAVYSRL